MTKDEEKFELAKNKYNLLWLDHLKLYFTQSTPTWEWEDAKLENILTSEKILWEFYILLLYLKAGLSDILVKMRHISSW